MISACEPLNKVCRKCYSCLGFRKVFMMEERMGIKPKSPTYLYCLFIWLLMLPVWSNGQDVEEFRISKITPETFRVESDLIDQNTLGVYLFETAEATVLYDIGEAPSIKTIVHFRFLVLDEAGLVEADRVYSLYKNNKDREHFVKAKGGVYNLVNGEVEFSKLKNSDWYIDEANERYDIARISFKNARVGSIIDFQFEIENPFYFRPDNWDFQKDDYPVLYSSYEFAYPEVMNYILLKKGMVPLSYPPIQSFSVYTPPSAIRGGGYKRISYKFIMNEIPAILDEPVIDSKENYRAKLLTELKEFNVIGGRYYDYYTDWETAAREFLEKGNCENFLKPSKRVPFFKCGEQGSFLDSVEVIFNHIQDNYEISDEPNYRMPDRTEAAVVSSAKATRSEINWLMVATCRHNGIEAHPVLYSDRKYERIHKEFPLMTQFKNVMAAVPFNGGYLLLDPARKSLKMDEVSEFSMNGEGFILKKKNPEWILMMSSFPSKQRAVLELDASKSGKLSGTMKLQLEGIYANRVTRYLESETPDLEELKSILHLHDQMDIIRLDESNFDEKQPLKLSLEVEYQMEKFGSSYLVPAILYDIQERNPFQGKERNLPIVFPDAWSESYTCLIHLEETEMNLLTPDKANYALPDNAASFNYSVSESLSNMVIRAKTEFNVKYYTPEQYSAIRQLYDLISTSHTSFIEIGKQ